jgi:3-methyladenine DNA glycosylase/8-oxoguanine DNA glycosylase
MATFRLTLPRDFSPRFALRYMTRDPESLTERGDTKSFAKAILADGKPAVVQVEFKSVAPAILPAQENGNPKAAGRIARAAQVAVVRTDAPRAAVERPILRLLGLPFDPVPFEAKHAKLVGPRQGMRVPQTASVFESIVWAVCGQQVNLAFAFKLRRVVIELAGKRVDGMHAHPDPASVARLDYGDLTRRQFSRRKAEYLIDVARSTVDFESLADRDPAAVDEELRAIRGFGVWSANYVMMRGCGFADCVPVGDSGLTSSLQDFYRLDARPDAEMTLGLMKRFAPYRSLATFHFWMRKSDDGF